MLKGNTMRETAGILLLRQRKSGCEILLVHDRKKWSIPKGGMELGETPEQAARRELWEETSIKIPSEIIPIGYVDYKKENKRLHGFVSVMQGSVKVALNEELIDSVFVKVEQARELLDERQCKFLDWVMAGFCAA